MSNFFVCLIVLLFLIGNVFAATITPNQININLYGGETKNFQLTIINDSNFLQEFIIDYNSTNDLTGLNISLNPGIFSLQPNATRNISLTVSAIQNIKPSTLQINFFALNYSNNLPIPNPTPVPIPNPTPASQGQDVPGEPSPNLNENEVLNENLPVENIDPEPIQNNADENKILTISQVDVNDPFFEQEKAKVDLLFLSAVILLIVVICVLTALRIKRSGKNGGDKDGERENENKDEDKSSSDNFGNGVA